MANFYVSNVNFESTGNNQLVYSANTVTIRVGNTNAAVINSSGIVVNSSINLPSSVNKTISSNTIITVNNSFTVTGAIIYGSNVTPTEISANTADWAPGVSSVYNIRVSANNNVANSEYMITGMTAGTNGQMVALHNIGPMGIWIRNEEAGSNGAIIPGVNTPGSTAANRFNLPNHFKLQGYQSATFYYDGILSRWRLTDSTSIAFDHKKALTKGFFAGGFSPAPGSIATTTDRTTYSTETNAAVPGANLSQNRVGPGGAGNATKGFFSGGTTSPSIAAGSASAVSDRTVYSTEVTSASTSSNLSSARFFISAAGTSCNGFYNGGVAPAGTVTTADRTTYSTETTAAVPGANLSQAKFGGGAAGNQVKGFFSSGGTNFASPYSLVATSDRTTYSTETTAAVPGANLSQARILISAVGNDCKGFFSGACTPAFLATTDRTIYSTETNAAVTGANLSQARGAASSAGNSCKGFFSGGRTGAASVGATADRITYSTETTVAVPGANLSAPKYDAAAI